ncbi:hypothetical protein BDZ97DRAFT_1922422 [Flammula alnicola]|nr:hypothetical protein BDZ97DRAFT_1922422 [Flammula alnicola]
MFKDKKSKPVAYGEQLDKKAQYLLEELVLPDFKDIPEFLPAMDSEDSESNTAPPIFQEIPEFLQPVDAGLNDIMDDLVIKDIPEFLPAMDSEDSESNAAPPIFQEIPEFLQLVDAGLNDIMDDVVFDVPALSPAMNCEDPESNTAAPYFRDIPAFSQSVAAGLNGDVAFEELILPVVEEIPEFLQSVAAGSNNVSDVQPSKTAWVASSHEDPSSDVHPFMPTISEALDAHRSLGRISSSLTYPEEALILASYAGLEAKRQQIYLREVRIKHNAICPRLVGPPFSGRRRRSPGSAAVFALSYPGSKTPPIPSKIFFGRTRRIYDIGLIAQWVARVITVHCDQASGERKAVGAPKGRGGPAVQYDGEAAAVAAENSSTSVKNLKNHHVSPSPTAPAILAADEKPPVASETLVFTPPSPQSQGASIPDGTDEVVETDVLGDATAAPAAAVKQDYIGKKRTAEVLDDLEDTKKRRRSQERSVP